MADAPERHRRRSIRLHGYDYAQAGAYFVTVCTEGRACVFGEMAGETVRLNDAGRMVESWWSELGRKFPAVTLDAYVVMPNHFHGIITIVGADLCVRPDCPPNAGQTHRSAPTDATDVTGAPVPVPKIIQWFKTMTTNEYIRGVKTWGWPPFAGKLWQRNYYEHIIRDEVSLNRIRQYIAENPLRWAFDCENPEATAPESEDVWRI